jgi:hypothetical protein
MKSTGRQGFAAGRAEALTCLAIFVITLLTFLLARVHQVGDSRYCLLLSQSLAERGSFALEHYSIPGVERSAAGGLLKDESLYQLEESGGHLYYIFPPGSSVLSVPYVVLMRALGISTVNPDGSYNLKNEVRLQAGLAALLMATLAGIFFYTARLILPLGWSIVVALGGAWGTQVWSTASRALWTDTWSILLLGIVVLMLLAHEAGRYRLRPILLSSLLAWTYFVRPTNALPILAITIYLLLYQRRLFAHFALTGAAWLAVFIAYSLNHYGRILPGYYLASRLTFEHFGEALAGNLISPARGLLVYVPVLLFVAYLLARYRRQLAHTRLVLLALGVIFAHWIAISGFPHWYGGHSYGPRLMTGLVPWFVLLAALSVQAMLKGSEQEEEHEAARPRAGRRMQGTLGAALLLLSIIINTLGATSHATALWNIRPVNVDRQPSRIWDWRHPQFLAKWQQ